MRARALAERHHWAALLLALALLGAWVWEIRAWMLDDAFISFRYAENFAAGHGLVYNVGERVEGYTTFLWVLLLGFAHRFGFDTVAASRWLGIGFAATTLLLLAGCRRFVRGADAAVAAVALLALGSCAAFTTWAASGMEVTLVGFLILLAVLLHLRGAAEPGPDSPTRSRSLAVAGSGVVCALATMSRPEASLVFFAILGGHLSGRLRRGRSGWLRFAAAFTVVYAPYFVWRWTYYGWLLPNTFYAKVGTTWEQVIRGMDYFTRWGGVSLPLLAAAAAGVLAAPAMRRRYGRVGAVPAVLALHAVYVIAVGGDAQAAFRFFGPIMPLLCLWAAMALRLHLPGRGRLAAATLLVVAFNLWQAWYHPEMRHRVRNDLVVPRGELAGRWLRENFDPDSLLATNTAGSIPYYSGLPTIDMLGLNDAHIAHRQVEGMGGGYAGHEKGDGAYVLSRKPDLIQFDSATGTRKPRRPSDFELWELEEFHRDYSFHSFGVGGGRRLNIYVRNPEADAGGGE